MSSSIFPHSVAYADTRGLEPEGSNTMAHGDHGDEDPMEKAMQLQRRWGRQPIGES